VGEGLWNLGQQPLQNKVKAHSLTLVVFGLIWFGVMLG